MLTKPPNHVVYVSFAYTHSLSAEEAIFKDNCLQALHRKFSRDMDLREVKPEREESRLIAHLSEAGDALIIIPFFEPKETCIFLANEVPSVRHNSPRPIPVLICTFQNRHVEELIRVETDPRMIQFHNAGEVPTIGETHSPITDFLLHNGWRFQKFAEELVEMAHSV